MDLAAPQVAAPEPRPAVAPVAATCQADADCGRSSLCLGGRCEVIGEGTVACDALAIHFAFDEASLLAGDTSTMQRALRCLEARPGRRARVEGHCDERGTTAYNLALGKRRAEAARRYLVDLGAPDSRIETTSFGKERPTCSEHTEACWSENRRADIRQVR